MARVPLSRHWASLSIMFRALRLIKPGAMNTVSAGFLTYLKGSGLPNRFQYYHHEFSKLRWHIEQRERDFWKGNGRTMDPLAEVALVEQIFHGVQLDIESSTPDRFLSASKQTLPDRAIEPVGLSDRVTSYRASQFEGDLKDAASQIDHRLLETKHGLEKQAIETRQRLERQAAETRERIENDAANTVREVEGRFDAAINGIGQRAQETVQQAEIRANQVSQKAEDRAEESESKVQDVAEKAAERVLHLLKDRKG